MPEDPNKSAGDGGSLTGRLTADRVGEALDALRFTIGELDRLGIDVWEHSRLKRHIAVLEPLEGAQSYPMDPDRRREIASAMVDAAQFSLVASVLPDRRLEALIVDLGRSIKGAPVRGSGESGEPYQFQSQVVFGALMAAAGHDVRVPSGEGLPDFIIPDGTLTHGVEVKRPASASKLKRLLKKAADQVARTGGRGLVVLDVSDLLETSGSEVVENEDGPDEFRTRFEADFRELSDSVVEAIQEPGTTAPRKRFSSIAAVAVMATGWLWINSSTVVGGWPESRAFFFGRRFYKVHDLTYHRGTKLRDMVETAVRNAGRFEITRIS